MEVQDRSDQEPEEGPERPVAAVILEVSAALEEEAQESRRQPPHQGHGEMPKPVEVPERTVWRKARGQ